MRSLLVKRTLQSSRKTIRRKLSTQSRPEQPQITGTLPRSGHGVQVGHYAETTRVFTTEDVAAYGRLVGDENPLHQSWQPDTLPDDLAEHPLVAWHEDRQQSKILVHGMLGASLFTCIFGTHIAGAVYLGQTLEFVQPIHVGDHVTGRVEVKSIRHMKRRGLLLTCDTTVVKESLIECIRGEANVWLVHGRQE